MDENQAINALKAKGLRRAEETESGYTWTWIDEDGNRISWWITEEEKLKCQNCGKKLDPAKAVWLELSNRSGNYYFVTESGPNLPEEESQGGFPFGKDCALNVGRLYKPEYRKEKSQ
jgi:hypothetical protein